MDPPSSPVDPSEQPGKLTTEGESKTLGVVAVKPVNLLILPCLNTTSKKFYHLCSLCVFQHKGSCYSLGVISEL